MPRPLSPAELAAIAAYLERRPVTRCPDTGRGEALPHLKPLSKKQAIWLIASRSPKGASKAA